MTFSQQELDDFLKLKIPSFGKHSLNLKGSNILSLPAGLKVNGYLDLSNTWIASLPEGLEVGSDLSLDYTMIEVLPKGLKVYGDLHIRRTRLKKYKYDELIEMIKPGFIFGNIESDAIEIHAFTEHFLTLFIL